MPKLQAMNITQLKRLLEENELSTTGKKAELVVRLSEAIGSDEAELPANSDASLQMQINELKNVIMEVAASIKEANNRNIERNNTLTNEEPTVTNELPSPNTRTTSRVDATAESECRFLVKEMSDLIPEFNPSNEGSLTAEQFLRKIDRAKSTLAWDERRLMLAVYERFKGAARDWLDDNPGFFLNYSEFSVAFLEEFGNNMNEAETNLKMQQSARKPNEKVSDYCFRMNSLGKRHALSEQAIINYTREGLRHHELQSSIATTRFNNMKQLRETCDMYFQNTKKSEKTGNTFKPVVKNEYHGTKRSEKVSERTLNCYNCNEPGHMSFQCPKPQRRRRCKDCQKVHPKGEPENCGKSVMVRKVESRKTKDMFLKSVEIAGKNFEAYIDTGSECHMIRRSCAKTILSPVEPCLLKMVSLWGGNCVATEKINVPIEVDEASISLTLYIVDDEGLPTDLLLGGEIFFGKDVNGSIKDGELKIFPKENAVMKTVSEHVNNNPITEADIKTGTNDRATLNELLNTLNKYRDVFADGLSELGGTDLLQMTIKLNVEQPIAQKPYRIPEPKKPVVEAMIKELLENDIIQRSTSSFASPMLLVKKKDGKDRLCIDYRKLNKHTEKEIFPMPNIDESLQKAKQYKFFVSLDMNSGFYQIPIEEDSQKFTAFITPNGLYEFKRMPFGLKNAPSVFQRLMFLIREKLPDSIIFYMDDMLVGGYTVAETLRKMEQVLLVLREAKLSLNLRKCVFLSDYVDFLGHRLTPNGIEPGEIKTLAIKNFPKPQSVTEVRRFLGLSGYFRKFVPNYAQIAEPLRLLLKINQPFDWGTKQEKAFTQLKEILIKRPVLTGFNVGADHEVHTDASTAGLAGVLLQNEGNQMKPVAYYSRSTTECERKYHSYELEVLAVVETLERFRYFIYGKMVKVITDCSAITTLMTKREVVPRIARWWLRIQDFEIQLEHRSGHRMPHVDALSRAPVEEPYELDVAGLRIAKVGISDDNWVFSMQMQDKGLQNIVSKLKQKDKETIKIYELASERLFRKVGEKLLWVVPKAMRWKMVYENHDKTGHLSVDKTMMRLRENFWFARMRNFVKSYVKSCVECAYNKTKGGQKGCEYHYTDIEPIPFHTVHVDHLGPFPRSSKRNEHVLVFVDAFTKFVVLKAVRNTSTKFVVEALNEISNYFGMPGRIISDRGTAYTSHEFRRYCENNSIQHQLNAVRTPRANGQVERMNRTILSMLKTMTAEDKVWDTKLRDVQWSLNSMTNSTTNRTPLQLLYGFTPRDILQNKLILTLHEDNRVTEEELTERREEAARRMNAKRAKAKLRFDQANKKPEQYNLGDMVLVESEQASIGHSRKLEPRYKGPYIITKDLGRDRYVVEELPKSRRDKRTYTSVYSSDKIKKWCQLPEDELDDDLGDDTGDEDVDLNRMAD